MTYQESLDYLTSLGRFGIKLGLERTEALLHALGNVARQGVGATAGVPAIRTGWRAARTRPCSGCSYST